MPQGVLASLRVMSQSVPPEQVTALAGVQPTDECHIGDPTRGGCVTKFHGWFLDSQLPDSASLDDHLDSLCTAGNGLTHLQGLPVKIELYCTITCRPHQDGMEVSNIVLVKAAALGASLSITLLTPGEDQDQ